MSFWYTQELGNEYPFNSVLPPTDLLNNYLLARRVWFYCLKLGWIPGYPYSALKIFDHHPNRKQRFRRQRTLQARRRERDKEERLKKEKIVNERY